MNSLGSKLFTGSIKANDLGDIKRTRKVPRISKRVIEFLGRLSSLRMKSLEHTSSYTQPQVVSNLLKYKVKTSLKIPIEIKPKG